MEDELIDDASNQSTQEVALEIMRWWERKRLLFNLIILGVAALTVLTYLFYYSNYPGFNESFAIFASTVLYFIIINICYCVGWGVQLLGYYYFKIQYDTKALEYVLFILGTLLTALVTYAVFEEIML